jgi:glycosyltransferase involved in cell wall biosynthesis
MASVDISVVIPTYNRKAYLKQAIESCFHGSSSIGIEVVVVDDGSTDGTRDYLQSLSNRTVRPIFQDHRGGQAARNRGLKEAQGRYIKFLDDDDWLAEGSLSAAAKVLNQTGHDLTFGSYEVVDSSGEKLELVPPPRGNDFASILFEGTQLVIPLNLTYRRDLIEGVRWDPSLPCRQDYAFALEVSLENPTFVQLNRITGFKREHQKTSVSSEAAKEGHTARVHGRILSNAAQRLRERGCLIGQRRSSVLNGLWTWAHLLAATDMTAFWRLYSFIEDVEPSFRPERPNRMLEILDNVLGPPATERILRPFR